MSDIPFKNPGWAGNTGEYDLSEEEVRGEDFVGTRPVHGGHASGAGTMPYMLAEKEPDGALFVGEYLERLNKILSRSPTGQAALLPALSLCQEIRGYVSPESMDAVAEVLDLSPAYVRGVATFYTMYNKRPVGRHLVQVCTNISCNLAGTCGISLPCGFTSEPKLPIGLQFLGKPFGESQLLQIAHAYEQATPWHTERASL